MKTFATMLVPALMTMLATPASTQMDALKPQKSDADLVLSLVATDKVTIQLGDFTLLDSSVLVMTRRGREMDSLPDAFVGMADLYWQKIGYHEVFGFCPGPIVLMPRDSQRRSKIDAQASDAMQADDAAMAGGDAGQGGSGLPMSLQFETWDGTNATSLWCAFDAPSNDYGLALMDVVDRRDGVDVYLYRKVPGIGEGLLDVVEHHSLSVELPGSGDVRVFLAEGTKSRPAAPLVWQSLARLSR